ncbi:WhiB family transcriptional regulator [Streptomyces sp. M2CJ-2]|uniref:WhiB family transcriptional regulator n=1 Tax=Streptomyces sp. M2CJ-2 TaxID=2803948 RepID=UPI001924302C|nr:WhiB family transcriptional regulator [Streptomyces sp. M2CJ-2]MBL3664458.1 WhiB family transcriptional regulator [Streptomyces sp. M2CJ-2]
MSAGRYAWMSSALCAQVDPDEWTDNLAGGGALAAKRICGRCPVKPACTAHAAALEQHDGTTVRGIWGGLSQNQRRRQQAAA